MAHVLRRLRISKIALTAQGAGKGVQVVLWKRRAGKMTFDELMATLPEEQRAIIVAHMEAMAAKPEPESEAEKALAAAEVAKALPESIRKALADGAMAQVELAKAREGETVRKYREQAATLDGMPGTTREDLATIWRAVEERLDAPIAGKTVELLKHVHAAIMSGAAARMTPIGSSAGQVPGTAHGKLEALAKSLRESKPTLTHAQAYAEALTQHPELYTEYRRDRDAAQ